MQEIVTQNLVSNPEKVAELPHAEADKIVIKPDVFTTILSPIGVTKASHEESKKHRKQAAKSRKINRGK